MYIYIYIYLVGGIPTPLKNDGVQVTWDDYSIPNCFWKVIQNSMVPVTTNQIKMVMFHFAKCKRLGCWKLKMS